MAWTENDAQEFQAVLNNIIDLAENRIYREIDLGTFREENSSLSTTGSVATVNFTSLSPRPFVIRWLALRPSGGTTFTPLDQKDDSYIQEVWADSTDTGSPRVYAVSKDGVLMFGPTPNGVYNIKMAYTVKPPSIVTTTTSWLGNYAPDVLLYACLVEAYAFMKGEEQAKGTWEAKYQMAVASLRQEEERRVRRTEFRTGEQGATS